jgi:hypothetical protein
MDQRKKLSAILGVELKALQTLGVVRGYCAMKPAEKDEEDGKKALAYNIATTVIVHGFGEEDIHLVGVILAAKGHYTLNMRDLAPMGLPVPEEKSTTRMTGDPTTESPKIRLNSGSQPGYAYPRLHSGMSWAPSRRLTLWLRGPRGY